MASAGNGSAALLDLRGARAALQAASGRQKLDLLLAAPDPLALVRSIPPEELYLALLEIGPEDASEAIDLASSEQFTHFVDMACWPGGDAGPEPARVLRWLSFARENAGHSDAALARYREKIAGLDPELLALVLRRATVVHDLEDDPDPRAGAQGNTLRTPEGRYLVEFSGGARDYVQMKALLDDLYAQDPPGTTRMLEALRWEVPTELEEAERRWRAGRLRDAGIPDREEALAFFARPRLRAPGTASAEAKAGLLAPERGPPLLERALAHLEGEALDHAEEGILYAANASVVASGVELDDPVGLRNAIEDARATLSLGLELLSGGEVERAAEDLAAKPVREIVQAAMGEAYRLQARARKAQKEARLPRAQAVTVLDPPLSDALEALAGSHPRFYDEGRVRAMGSRADLARAEGQIDQAEATLRLLRALGLSIETLAAAAEEARLAPTAVRSSDAVRALVLGALRGEAFSLRDPPDPEGPLPAGFADRLADLLRGALGSVPQEADARAASALRARLLDR